MPVWTVIVAMILASAITLAAVIFTYDITNQMEVYADYTIEVRSGSQSGPLITNIDWGTFYGATDSVAEEMFIVNVGNVESILSWTTTNFPSMFSITGEVYDFETTSWLPWNEGANNPIGPISPGVGGYHKARITVTLDTVTPGSYSFDLHFHANDGP